MTRPPPRRRSWPPLAPPRSPPVRRRRADRPAPARPAGSTWWPRFYPLQYVAERVGGDRVTVTNLTSPAPSRTTWS